MLNYTTLTQEFVTQLQNAILNYQTTHETITEQRARDIAALTAALRNHQDDIFTLRTSIETILDNLATGWLFFRTGNSELKSYLEAILSQRRFQNETFLQRQILDLQQQVLTLKQNPVYDARVEELETALEDAQNTIAQQDKEIETLSAQNEALRKKILRYQAVLQNKSGNTKLTDLETVTPIPVQQHFQGGSSSSAFFENKSHTSKMSKISTQSSSEVGTLIKKSKAFSAAKVDVDVDIDDEGYVSPGSAFALSMSFNQESG